MGSGGVRRAAARVSWRVGHPLSWTRDPAGGRNPGIPEPQAVCGPQRVRPPCNPSLVDSQVLNCQGYLRILSALSADAAHFALSRRNRPLFKKCEKLMVNHIRMGSA